MIQKQRGYATLLLVMMLLAFSMMMLKGVHRQLDQRVRMQVDERRYLQNRQRAHSALAWASSLRWSLNGEGWRCERHEARRLNACVRALSSDELLIHGSGYARFGEMPAALFQRALVRRERGESLDVGLIPLPASLSDVCPLVGQPVECEP
ncbi:DUF2509 family protein [Leminorella grimontii]|uniref:DUF2509 family protein n=1 Tax=Leminorella grimontii TaxID=82981 RepID=UPI00321F75CC